MGILLTCYDIIEHNYLIFVVKIDNVLNIVSNPIVFKIFILPDGWPILKYLYANIIYKQ